MARVTIEGSLSPSVELARGVRRTVTVTDHIRRLVAGGFVIVVDGSLDDDPEPVAEVEPPAGNATTEEWLQFLRDQDVEVPVGDDGETPGREALKALWASRVDGGS
ncbi:hypothetical protein H7K45_27710 [Mycobacterium yunnanensis]|uniref:Uncharacterized protein n=1 Tax=Mycobacterium yunnanensis TaxID=368477 RepID=A0A9X3BW59_9MYCO|nr:hypothetical protein [Mycobacterium yunnanensis]MCV7424339.1 hypothetical protein [Mycobacterium yunnanensis]